LPRSLELDILNNISPALPNFAKLFWAKARKTNEPGNPHPKGWGKYVHMHILPRSLERG
jgi:hypothetical protein